MIKQGEDMKKIILLLTMIFVVNSHAGRETGNGGFAYVCRDSNGKISSARLLDLWEGAGLNTWSKSTPMEKQIEQALDRIKDVSPNFYSMVKSYYLSFKGKHFLSNRTLTKTEDAFPTYVPEKGCNYEQVARFELTLMETGQRGLRINKEIYQSEYFSETDRAALMLHEAIYLVDRNFNDAQTSARTRLLVAHLFSDSKLPNAIRMTFGKMIALPTQWTEKIKKRKRVFAAENPKEIEVIFQIGHLDGVQSYSGEASAEQRAKQYRCEIDEIGDIVADTGWISIGVMLDLDNPDVGTPGNPYFALKGKFISNTTAALDDSISMISEGIRFSCWSRENKTSEEIPVEFKGYYYLGEGNTCLNESIDGSVIEESGDNCMSWIKGDKENRFFDFAPFEIVKALNK